MYAGSKFPINLLNVNYIQERIESQSDIYTRAQHTMHLFLDSRTSDSIRLFSRI